jgi:hypothetical protein
MPLHNSSTITNISIPMLLDWWQQRKRLANALGNLRALPKEDETYLQSYYRLMEVYSVVKSGGVKAQTEAVQAFAKRESGLLNQRLAEIEAAELAEGEKRRSREKIKQEMTELRCANDWRLKALTNIEPEEEAVVKQYLPDIEKTLMQAQCA